MGNVLGINTISDTVYVRNNGSILDTISSVTIFEACGTDAVINSSAGWTVTTSVNSGNNSKLDVTFTYDAGTLLVNSLTASVTMGLVGGISVNIDPSNVLLHWKRTPTGNVNISSNVETTVSLLYEFHNLIFNNNIIFTTNQYIMNFMKTCLQDYTPIITNISTTVTEDGHSIVEIGSVTVGSGVWYITATGGFNLSNKKYFFLTDKVMSDFSTATEYYAYINSNQDVLSSFGTHQINTLDNVYPVNTSIVYDNPDESNVIHWCFTCENSAANKIIFEDETVSNNAYVDGHQNNLQIIAIKISF